MKAIFPLILMAGFAPALHAESTELTAQSLSTMCRAYLTDAPDKTQQSAYCQGYVEATTAMFHSGTIKNYIPKSICFDLSGEIPDWETPIQQAVQDYVAAKPYIDENETTQALIAKAVAKAYPCKKGPEGHDEDDRRTYGTL